MVGMDAGGVMASLTEDIYSFATALLTFGGEPWIVAYMLPRLPSGSAEECDHPSLEGELRLLGLEQWSEHYSAQHAKLDGHQRSITRDQSNPGETPSSSWLGHRAQLPPKISVGQH